MTIIRSKAQAAAMRILQETLRLIRADVLVREACWREGSTLLLAGNEFDLSSFRKVFVLGAGKASAAMAVEIDHLLTGSDTSGLVVTKDGHVLEAGRIEVIEAGHPLPDERSIAAGERILEMANSAGPDDLAIVLISGGASALVEAPAEGVTLADLRQITSSLLRSGADIHELNLVRSCLSRIKAGGLARACGKAALVVLILSDVPGNPREIIGSGPCWGRPPRGDDALEVLRRRQVRLTPGVEKALGTVRVEEPAAPLHIVLGDIYTALEAAAGAAAALGFSPKVYGRTFSGEAREVGARMAAEALALGLEGSKYDCVIAGGESTVAVRGKGLGGRSQELACAAALALADVPHLALLAVGTDGTDGPTDAAGGLIDGETYKRASLLAALDTNDSYHALEEAAALVATGPTQTNLNDLVIITRVPES